MNLDRNALAQALYETRDSYHPSKIEWDDLPHHAMLHWGCEADHVMRAIYRVEREEKCQP